jgi:hypothetical protein
VADTVRMSQSVTNHGLQITPLTLWVMGITCALISFIGITGLVKLDKVQDAQSDANTKLATIVTSQNYDRKELEDIKGNVKAVTERVSKLEQAK